MAKRTRPLAALTGAVTPIGWAVIVLIVAGVVVAAAFQWAIIRIMEVGHTALLEHATATMYITGLSRSASHELVRHRHFSFSQLSQRFVHPEETEVVLPKLVAEDEQLSRLVMQAVDETRFVYDELLSALEEKLDEPNALLRKKQARQAARAVLPNATETRIVVTGNYRAWRHFIGARAAEQADEELRHVAVGT